MNPQQQMNKVIAIDGPAGSGKSTVSRLLADEISFIHVDSGALYRTYTLIALEYCKEKNISLEESVGTGEFFEFVDSKNIHTEFKGGVQEMYLDEKNISEEIRTPEVTDSIKLIADHPRIRNAVNGQLRIISKQQNIIVDGRDIGTEVFPDADCKFFLSADIEERARRRFQEFTAKYPDITLDQIQARIRERDDDDSSREMGALKQASDAIFVDTTGQKIKAVVQKLKTLLLNKFSL